MPLEDMLDKASSVQQGTAVDVCRLRGEGERHRAVGRGIDDALSAHAMLEERERSRMREAGQGLRVELAGEHEAAFIVAQALGARSRLIEHRHDGEGAVGERRDHRRRGEEDVQHDHDLSRQPHGVELLLTRQHVDLVVEFDTHAHLRNFAAGERLLYPFIQPAARRRAGGS